MKPIERQMLYLFVFLLIIFLTFIVGIAYYHKNYDTAFFAYHGFTFKQVAHGFEIQLYINDQQTPRLITLRSDPRDVEDIPLDSTISLLLDAKRVYATINPFDNLTGTTTIAVLEVDKILDNQFLYNVPVNATFTEEYLAAPLAVRTCADSTADEPVLWFHLEDMTQVYRHGSCFVVAGKTEDDLIRAADRILYALIGIMSV